MKFRSKSPPGGMQMREIGALSKKKKFQGEKRKKWVKKKVYIGACYIGGGQLASSRIKWLEIVSSV